MTSPETVTITYSSDDFHDSLNRRHAERQPANQLTIGPETEDIGLLQDRLREARYELRRIKNKEAAARRRKETREMIHRRDSKIVFLNGVIDRLAKEGNQLRKEMHERIEAIENEANNRIEDIKNEANNRIDQLIVLPTNLALLIQGSDQRQMANHLLLEAGLQAICGGESQ